MEDLREEARPDGAVVAWQDILDFERDWGGRSGPKGAAVRRRFGLSLARYHQLLNRTLDQPEALGHDPVLVRRLRRLREARRRIRFSSRLGPER